MSGFLEKKPRILLAFDFGLKRIGVAVGQIVTVSARPLTTLKANQGKPELAALNRLMKEWRPDALIVGIPLNMDGTDQSVTQAARDFAEWLRHEFQLPVFEADERLTTKDAREKLFNKGGIKALQHGQVDSVAAQLILQNWLAQITEEEKKK